MEPTDAGRVGDSFTFIVTVYDNAGNKASAPPPFHGRGGIMGQIRRLATDRNGING